MGFFDVIILAAGDSTRLKSEKTKVLHPLCGRPMLVHVVETVMSLKPRKVVLVLGRQLEEVRRLFPKEKRIIFAHQKERLGTAHATGVGLKALKTKNGRVLIVNGDGPLVKASTLKKLAKIKAPLVMVTAELANPFGYGRILRDANNQVQAIVEEKNATPEQKKIKEINAGLYNVDLKFLRQALKKIPKNPVKGEYYLTDLGALAKKSSLNVKTHCLKDSQEILGVNTREDLAQVQAIMLKRMIKKHLEAGVGMEDPQRVYVEAPIKIGADTYLEAGVRLVGNTKVGKNCYVEAGAIIKDCSLADGVRVKAYSYLEDSSVASGSVIGPFAHLRPGNRVGKNCKIGNFVELKKSKLSEGVKAGHLSYLGDSVIGKNVNIGAGTITCNYDGKKKYQTIIKEGVFIGSDTQLVAPVKLGEGAYVGAGTTVTKDVPAGNLAISRVQQKNIKRKKRT